MGFLGPPWKGLNLIYPLFVESIGESVGCRAERVKEMDVVRKKTDDGDVVSRFSFCRPGRAACGPVGASGSSSTLATYRS